MKLSEALSMYVPPEERKSKLDNRRIRTYLRKTVRAIIESELHESWESITRDYWCDWNQEGDPETGYIEIILKDAAACRLNGRMKQTVKRRFTQASLFEKED